MKTKYFWISFLFLFLILACNLSGQTQTPPSAVEAVSTTETLLPTFTETPELPIISNGIAECKKSPVAFTNVGLGIPNPSHKLPTIGNVKTIVLFVDFNDAPASQTPEQVFSLISPNAEKFFNDISYGKMNYVLEPYFTWLRLSQPSAHYGQGIRTYD